MLCVFAIMNGHAVRMLVLPSPIYKHFICHHKVGAAAQSRVIQILLCQAAGGEVFIDSDHLGDPDQHFGAVRSSVRNLVVYLARETMRRPWCIGEMTIACANMVKIIAVRCGDSVLLSDVELDHLESTMGSSRHVLTENGIPLLEAGIALRSVRDLEPVYEVPSIIMSSSMLRLTAAVLEASKNVRNHGRIAKRFIELAQEQHVNAATMVQEA